MDQGRESGEQRFSRDESRSGEAWEPEDEAGHAAWDDGSQEIWDDAELGVVTRSEQFGEEDVPHTALPPKVEAWRKRSATGAILTGFAFGLQQVFEPKEEPGVIMETSGEPPRDLPVEADFEYGRPRNSVVNIRPWLLPGDQQPAGDQGRANDQQPSDDEEPADAQQPSDDQKQVDGSGNGTES